MKTALAVVVLLSFVCVIGCKSEPKPEASAPPAPVTVAEMNSAKLQNAVVPQAVQTAFGHDHPDAQIDTIEMHSTSTGDSFYQITYMSQGHGGTARYFATGKALPAN